MSYKQFVAEQVKKINSLPKDSQEREKETCFLLNRIEAENSAGGGVQNSINRRTVMEEEYKKLLTKRQQSGPSPTLVLAESTAKQVLSDFDTFYDGLDTQAPAQLDDDATKQRRGVWDGKEAQKVDFSKVEHGKRSVLTI